MKYGDLLPSLLERNLVQLKAPPATLITPPWWYKPEAICAFHQGAPGHDTENCYALKVEVQKIINNGILSFQDLNLNVSTNLLPRHHEGVINMVHGCPGEFRIYRVQDTRGPLVEVHRRLAMEEFVRPHACRICAMNPRGCQIVKRDIQGLMDEGILLIHRERGGEPVNAIDDNNRRAAKRPLEDASTTLPKRLRPGPHDAEVCEVCREIVDTLRRWVVVVPFSIRREKVKQQALDNETIILRYP